MDIMARVPELVEKMTGVDIVKNAAAAGGRRG